MRQSQRLLFCSGLLLAVGLASTTRSAEKFEDAFVFSFIDRQFEQLLGGPPFDRALYARAVEKCRELGAKGVVIKLFLDRERTAAGDEALAQAMSRLPVVLQARIEPATGRPDDLPDRFRFPGSDLPTSIAGERGWIPIPRLLAVAADVGFVDFDDDSIPLLETYRNASFKSVVLCALELHSGAKARLNGRAQLMIADRVLPSDPAYVQKVERSTAPLPYISLPALLAGNADTKLIRGRIVVLGYTGSDAPMIKTPAGDVEAHVFFGQCLRAVFESMKPTKP
jgi:CHASE2 domain-containing sensor protein